MRNGPRFGKSQFYVNEPREIMLFKKIHHQQLPPSPCSEVYSQCYYGKKNGECYSYAYAEANDPPLINTITPGIKGVLIASVKKIEDILLLKTFLLHQLVI